MTIVNSIQDHILGLQHVGHIVADLDEAVTSFCRLYGVDPGTVRRVPTDEAQAGPTRFAFVTVADTEFELIEAVSEPFKTLLDRSPVGGAGINHVAWRVCDLDICLQKLRREGVLPGHVTPDGPVAFADRRLVYLDPETCGGLLVELIEISDECD